MKTFSTKSAAALTGLAMLASASVTMGDVVSITFDVGGITSQNLGNDTVSAAAKSTTDSFTLGQATQVTLQNLTWTQGASQFGVWEGNLSRLISVTLNGITQSGSLTQYGALYNFDPTGKSPETLSAGGGATTIFTIGQYLVDITPETGSWTHGGTYSLTASITVTEVSPVPETTTMLAGAGAVGLLFLGAGAHSKRNVFRIGKGK